MIVLYNGRLVIERRLLSENWRAIIKVTKKGKVTLDLQTPDVRTAFIRAQAHYSAMKTSRPAEEIEAETVAAINCWSCQNWMPRTNECSFGFPEAVKTRGRYASRCELFDDARLPLN